MTRPYEELLSQLRQRLVGPLGKLAKAVRQDILDGRIVDGRLNAFVVKVQANASSIVQADIDALKAEGFDEDQIFDAAVCAAFRAGEERYKATLHALEEQ